MDIPFDPVDGRTNKLETSDTVSQDPSRGVALRDDNELSY